MRKLNKKFARPLVLLFTLLVLFSAFYSSQSLAAYPNNSTEFKDYLKKIGKPTYIVYKGNVLDANFTTYKTYQLIVYGSHSDVPGNDFSGSGNLCKPSTRDEWRYLGYSVDKTPFDNYCFRNDKTGSKDPEDWNYQVVDPALQSWNKLDDDVASYVYNAKLSGHGATNLTVAKIGGKKYGKVTIAPTWKTDGDLYTENYAAGKIWYADFIIPHTPEVFTSTFDTDKDTYRITSDQYSVNLNYTVSAKISGVPAKQVDSIQAGFDPTGYNNIGSKDYVTKTKTLSVSKTGKMTLDRAKYKPGTYKITLTGSTKAESIFNDKDAGKPSKTITLIVDEDNGPPSAKTTITVTPSEQQYSGKDVTVTVSVKGTAVNIKDSSVIKSWSISYKPQGSSTSTVKTLSGKSLSASYTFKTTIPKSEIESKIKSGSYSKVYEGFSSFVLSTTGKTVNGNKPTAAVNISKGAPPPPPVDPEEPKQPPIAAFTWSPITGNTVGDSVSLIDQSYSPTGVPIVSWHWSCDTGSFDEQNPSLDLLKQGFTYCTLTVTDAQDMSASTTNAIWAERPNIPPVAQINVEDEYYWNQIVNVQNTSYDVDGTIVSNDFTLDNNPSGQSFGFSQITEPEIHTVGLEVTDNMGATDQTTKQFRVLPTIPTADFSVYGFDNNNQKTYDKGKVNRLIEIDSTLSDAVTAAKDVAPIDYSKTIYKIEPKTDGIDQTDILQKASTDKKKLQFLVRKPGDYEVTVQVVNKYGEISRPVTKDLHVVPDEAPFASFKVDKKIYYRDGSTQYANITLTDQSESKDNDKISNRKWYVEFDSNNDGEFGTRYDTPKQLISSGTNNLVVNFTTNKVGHYRFSEVVTEDFGQPTIPEFITPEDYLTDLTEPLAPMGTIDEYMKDENFNVPGKDVAIEVDNVQPSMRFTAGLPAKKIDVVVDVGGLDVATQHHDTTKNDDGSYYDNYYYTIDSSASNSFVSKASNIQKDLLAKGLDVNLTTVNNNNHILDADGPCIRNVPIWGWTIWYTYDYDTVSTTDSNYQPTNGFYITSKTSKDYYKDIPWCSNSSGGHAYPCDTSTKSKTVTEMVTGSCTDYFAWTGSSWNDSAAGADWTSSTTKSYNDGTYSGTLHKSSNPDCNAPFPSGKGKKVGEIKSTRGTATAEFSGVVSTKPVDTPTTKSVYDYTIYTYNLKRDNYHQKWEIQRYEDQGCQNTEQLNTKEFSDKFSTQTYRTGVDKYYVRLDNLAWDWGGKPDIVSKLSNKVKSENLLLWSIGPPGNRSIMENLQMSTGIWGLYSQLNFLNPNIHVPEIEDYLTNKYLSDTSGNTDNNLTIVLGENVNLNTYYSDYENDPELKREYMYQHDPNSVNGRTIDDPGQTISQNGLWIKDQLDRFDQVGTYKIFVHSQDNPVFWNDDRFFNYRKWSDKNPPEYITVNVHRRPIADFKFNLDLSNKLSLDPSLSYDPDHKYNRTDKGIVEYSWSYSVDNVDYQGQPPVSVEPNKQYVVTLKVKDIDGAYGSVTKTINTFPINDKPVAKFDVQDIAGVSTPLKFTDLSYDPNGDPLTNYKITIRKQGDNTILKNLSSFPNNFASLGLGKGTYVIGLTVDDIPKYPPSLTSDLFEKTIKVIPDNRPPVSLFTLSPNPVTEGDLLTYKDLSYDPDGDPLINYSWKVEKLDDSGNTVQSWITGAVPLDLRDFGGVGKYKISQTVYDSPPSPLPSMSDTSSVFVEMVKAKERPIAQFVWWPEKPYEGKTITLDPTSSYDLDGDVTGYEWTIKAPNGTVTTSTETLPQITNAQLGDYEVQLYVTDNDGLRSRIPSIQKITVYPLPPNIPPVASFIWDPSLPFLGEKITLNPDASFDVDGTIVKYDWKMVSNDGEITASTSKYPTLVGVKPYYDVTLTVTDDRGGTGTVTQRIGVDIAKLTPLVTHTPKWQDFWVKQGEDKDTNKFLAGEHFSIVLKTTPAKSVWGDVQFGGEIGTVDIPSNAFSLINKTPFEYTWKADLYQSNFIKIKNGKYVFNFHASHPDSSTPLVQSNANYQIEIVGNIYDAYNFHRTK